MKVNVRIPMPLYNLTKGKSLVNVEANNLRELIDILDAEFPGFKEKVCDKEYNLRKFINIFLNGEDIRFLEGLETKLSDGNSVTIITAVAGG
ncbi:MAG: MoaD/ThiS family protein [Candidatus Omnitrophota bacterium]